MAWIGKLLEALIAVPKLASYIEAAVKEIVLWYVQRETAETHQMIADAAATAARAQTQEERFHAAELWRRALSRPRIGG